MYFSDSKVMRNIIYACMELGALHLLPNVEIVVIERRSDNTSLGVETKIQIKA